ncbi:hypothetical protein [Ornithinimicrobium kibberense]|uniref:hypothetical protein n=1 Tax=Ornithinimicrobium kibberense TaxID=282060 RepID=UPI00114328D5|nr:hypothetical protein [Ornithinimicrobium kibberense]
MAVHDELEAVMAAGRWENLRPYVLADPDSAVHRSVAEWYRSRHAHWAEVYRWDLFQREQDPAVDGRGALRILALAFLPPARAARELGRLSSGWGRAPWDALGVEVALSRGADFCRSFLDAASRLTFGKEELWSVGWLARFGLPLVQAGVAELPDEPTFGHAWSAMFGGTREHPLVEEMRDTPFLAEGLAVALATPDAFARFETMRVPGQELELALAQLVAERVLDRERVVDSVLEALTRQDSDHSQRALARILGALELEADDAAARLPLLLHLLATARGPVTAVLLPAVIAAAGDEEIPAVATTVFTRPEKAQRTTLLRALVAKDAPWGRPARVQALQVAADLPDRALAERAGRTLARLGAEPAPPPGPAPGGDAAPSQLWTDPPPVDPPRPVTVVEPHEASMRAALSRLTAATDPSDGAMFWDGAVRWAFADARAAVAWARGLGDRVYEMDVPAGLTPLRAEPWDLVGPAEHRRLRETTARFHTGVRAPYDPDSYGVTSRSTTQALHKVLMSETTRRLGEIPLVVSTPTRTDGTLELPALVERLRGYAAGGHLVGPVDLFVALARLEEVDPGRAAELDGVAVGLWSEEETGGMQRPPRSRRHVDAAQLVRDWIRGGGLPPLRVSHRDGALDVAPPTLPVPAEAFGGIPPSLVAGHEDGVHMEYSDWSVGAETDVGVVPAWADLLAARMQRSFDQKGRFPPKLLPALAASPRPGPAVVHAVTATLSHADEDCRLLAVDAALTLMGRGLWDPAGHTTCCQHLLADGQLRLARLAHSWEQLVLAGGLRLLWPTAVAVLDGACGLAKKPPGLAEVLGMLRRYVPAVPDVVVPGSVSALATSKGSSKAKVEAAAFVQSATAGAATAGAATEAAS